MRNVTVNSIGEYIREQREQAKISMRQLAQSAGVSNPYLSQIERGLHQPSVRVIRLISEALNVSAETLLIQAGLLRAADSAGRAAASEGATAEAAIQADERLTPEQKTALIAVYRSMLRPD